MVSQVSRRSRPAHPRPGLEPGASVALRRLRRGGSAGEAVGALAFLATYGWAMWAVQQFEYNPAALTILRSPVKSPNRKIDSAQKLYSALEKQFAKYRHRLERASAKELQKLLPDDLPETLRSNLGELIVARNDLAHRYLRRTLDEKATDLETALRTVQALGQRFVDVGEELLALAEKAVAARPSNLSDEQYDNLQRLGRAVASGTPLDEALAALARPVPG
jgi:hypothetical protein